MAQYLKLSGGTLTGAIKAVANKYFQDNEYGLDMNNSDIIGINSLVWNDPQDSGEGLFAKRTNDKYDLLKLYNGILALYTNCDSEGNNGTYIPLSGWTDITSLVTLTAISSLGSYTISQKKFYMCGCFVKINLEVIFNYATTGGSTPLQLKLSCPLFSTSKNLSSTYTLSYYGAGIWTVGLNVYTGEDDIISFRPNQNFGVNVDAHFSTIIAVNPKDVG